MAQVGPNQHIGSQTSLEFVYHAQHTTSITPRHYEWLVADEGRSTLSLQRFTVAVVQAAPVAFNREQTLIKVKTLAGEASALGAKIVLFPEAFVSAYPTVGLIPLALSSARGPTRDAKTTSDSGRAVLMFPVRRRMNLAVSPEATAFSLLSVWSSEMVERSTAQFYSFRLMAHY